MDSHIPDMLGILISGCKKNDRASQKKLYEELYGYAMSICIRYSHNEEEAIEILNDGFMKVFTKIGKYNPQLSFPGWVRRIMINTAIDYFRRNKKHFNYKALDALEHSETELAAAAETAISKISYEEIVHLVQQLPPSYRTVFNLYVIDGFNHREIAEKLRISEGASKSNLSKARERLKRLLKNVYHAEYAKFTG